MADYAGPDRRHIGHDCWHFTVPQAFTSLIKWCAFSLILTQAVIASSTVATWWGLGIVEQERRADAAAAKLDHAMMYALGQRQLKSEARNRFMWAVPMDKRSLMLDAAFQELDAEDRARLDPFYRQIAPQGTAQKRRLTIPGDPG